MSRRSPDIYMDTVRESRHNAAPCKKFSVWELGGPVYGDAAPDVKLFDDVIFRESLRAASPLARRLKEKDYPLLQLAAVFRKDGGRSEQGSHLRVMAAAVHRAGHTGRKGQPRLFLGRRRVHRRAQHQRRAGYLGPQHADHRGLNGKTSRHRHPWNRTHNVRDLRRRYILFKSKLRKLMKITSPVLYLAGYPFSLRKQRSA